MDGPNRVGIELEDIAEAMSQLANIGSELLRPEDDRDPLWRSIPVAKEIMVTKGIASRAPWEAIQVFLFINTSYLTNSCIVFTLKMKSVSKNTPKNDGEKWS